jgi:hypothetical protein
MTDIITAGEFVLQLKYREKACTLDITDYKLLDNKHGGGVVGANGQATVYHSYSGLRIHGLSGSWVKGDPLPPFWKYCGCPWGSAPWVFERGTP